MKQALILCTCIMLFPAVLQANPVPAFYVGEFSTGEDWIELMGHFEIKMEKGSAFTVNGDTVYVVEDVNPTSFENPFFVLNQENTSGFDLPENGGEIFFVDYWASVSYGIHGRCPAPPPGASAAFHLEKLPYWSDSSPQSIWSLDFTPTPGKENDLPLPAYGDGTVFINEFFPGELSGSDDPPFIELYNRSDESIDIGGWRLVAGSLFNVPEGTVIAGQGFHVIESAGMPEGFFPSPASGTLYIVNGAEELVDQAGWSEAIADGETLIRYPDGFVTESMGYDSETSFDFRAGHFTTNSTVDFQLVAHSSIGGCELSVAVLQVCEVSVLVD